ncbi:MAG: zinc-dependent alcohol dehydrogenase family protein [Armatimonadota bacterium]|nr:zinc-dependent alcohol dehydrogenase family protein [Armatimonadota bacterium]
MKTRAAILYDLARPIPYADSHPLQVEEVALDGPGPGEVLVEVAAAGLCHSDLSVVDGSRPRAVPVILGHEASGIVREVGPNVTAVAAGDHVVFSFVPACGRCVPCATGRPALCEPGVAANAAGTLLSGARRFAGRDGAAINHFLGVSAFSHYTVAAQESLVRIDTAFPLDRAAIFGCAIVTGVGAVTNTARVEPGASVAVFGLGGVGLSAVMGARLAGAHPIIAVDLLDDKLAAARAAGATHTVNAQATDPVQAIRDLTRGGVQYAFEGVGSEQALAQAYQATRRGGTTVSMGLPAPSRLLAVPATQLVVEERTIKGSFMGSAVPRRDIPRFLDLHATGVLPVDILLTRSLPLEDINAGFDALRDGRAIRQLLTFV